MPKLNEFELLAVKIRQEYNQMSQVFSSYQDQSALKCPSGCGDCCFNPDIEATPLEMLPMALSLLDKGQLDADFLASLDQHTYCVSYQKTSADGAKGTCKNYNYRPSICRMFAVAGFKNKDESISLSVCRKLKEKYPNDFGRVSNNPGDAPIMEKWSTRIRLLDPSLGLEYHKINIALKIMAEKVLTLATYENLN